MEHVWAIGPRIWRVLLYNGHEGDIGWLRLTTHNRMEIYAAIAGLSALNCSCEVILYTVRYLADAMNKGWVKRWKAKVDA